MTKIYPKTMDLLNNTKIDLFDWNSTSYNQNETEFRFIFHNLNANLSENYIWLLFATKILIIFFYCLLIIVSLIGNFLVIRVLLCVKFGSTSVNINSKLEKHSNIRNSSGRSLTGASKSHRLHIHTGTGTSKLLIVNLAISDLLLTTFNIPVNLIRYLTDDWPFGDNVCRLVPFVQSVSAYCSAWTMLFIAFERFRKIIQQQKFHRRLASQQQQHHHHHHHHHHHNNNNNHLYHHHCQHSSFCQVPCNKNYLKKNNDKNGNSFTQNSYHDEKVSYNDEYALKILSKSVHLSKESINEIENSLVENPEIQESSIDNRNLKDSTIINASTVSSTSALPEGNFQLLTSAQIDIDKRSESVFSTLKNKLYKFSIFCCSTRIFMCFRKKKPQIVKICEDSDYCNCRDFVPYYSSRMNVNNIEGRLLNRNNCDNLFETKLNNKKKKISKRTELDSCLYRRLPAWLILLLVWGIALILSYPHTLHTGVFRWKHPHPSVDFMVRCRINLFPDNSTKVAQSFYSFVSQYAIPIGITSLFYIHIGAFLWKRETVGALSEGKKILMLKRKRRRVRMLIFVVLVFAACWAPLNLYGLATDYGWIEEHQSLFFFFHMIAMSSVCYNPFIYCWLNETFRRRARSVLRRLIPCTGSVSNFFGETNRRLRGLRRLDHPLAPIFYAISGNANAENDSSKTERVNDEYFSSPLVRLDVPTGEQSSTWSSSTMSATGKQQAISELISMSALLENDLLDSSKRFSTKSSNFNGISQKTLSGEGKITTTAILNENQSSDNQITVIGKTSSFISTDFNGKIDKNNRNNTITSAGSALNNELNTALKAKQERLALTTTQSGKRRLHVSID